MARLPYLGPEDVAPEHRGLLRDINLAHLTIHSPGAAHVSHDLAMYIRNGSTLDPRLREMAIIQIGYLTRSVYEYAHHVKIGLAAGVSEDDIRAIAAETASRPTGLDPLTQAVLRAARDLTRDIALDDETFAQLQRHLGNEKLMDLFLAICSYNSTVRLLAALQVDLEEEYRPYLERFPLPQG